MTILAVDTTSEFGSVAIWRDGETIAEVREHSREGLSHWLFGAIERCRNEAGLDLGTIDGFAAAAGPGSFTGVRVGLSAVKGLAESFGKPAAAISNLQALRFCLQPNTGHEKVVLLDARRSEVYAAIFDDQLSPTTPETVGSLDSLLRSLETLDRYEFLASEGLPLPLSYTPAPRYLATVVASCAADSPWSDPSDIDANYVRRSDAEIFWTDSK